MASSSTINSRQVPIIQYATPATGATVTMGSSGFIRLLLNPAGTLATLTITLASGPSDGDMLQLCSTQIVTGLTMNGGTIIGGLTTMAVGTFASYCYSGDAAQWFRCG